MAIRVDRINTQIQREISLILQNEIRDRDLKSCTVTAVETTNDLSFSKVYVTFMDKSYNRKKGLEALQRSKGFIRSLLSKRLTTRKCPELQFILDTSLEYGNKIEDILRKLNNEQK